VRIVLILLFLTVGLTAAENINFKKTAQQYFNSLVGGDTDTADKIVGVPFSLDRKKVLHKLEEVKAVHQKVMKDKGKRQVPANDISIPDDYKKLDEKIFKDKYKVVRFTLKEGKHKGDKIDIYLKMSGKKYVVIGFAD
jgi:hypothetical protein